MRAGIQRWDISEMNVIDVSGALLFASSGSELPDDETANVVALATGIDSSSVAPASSAAAGGASGATNAATVPDAPAQAAPKRAYPAPAEIPTQQGPKG